MENNEMIKEIIRSMIPESMIKETVDAVVNERVYEILDRYEMQRAIKCSVDQALNEHGNAYIKEIVDGIINGKVRIDDGWGNVTEYGTFEDYCRKSMQKNLSSWNLERKLRDEVDNKLKAICKKVSERHKEEDLIPEVLSELAAQYDKIERK